MIFLLSQTKKVKAYKHIFIDLDRTLWDFEANARDTLHDIYRHHKLGESGVKSFSDFLNTYRNVNHHLWELYRKGKIEKSFLSVERFRKTLETLGLEEGLANEMSAQYLDWSPLKKKLFPGVLETLDYLSKKYQLHILTNGFNEVQFRKVENSGFTPFFKTIVTSDDAGCKKPNKAFFEYAFNKTSAQAENAIMIGDDAEVDIKGAQHSGIDQVYVNYDSYESNGLNPTYEIHRFTQLKDIL